MTFILNNKRGEIVFEGERVRNSLPCPICAHLHRNQSWCLIDIRRGLAICPRVKSEKQIGDAGWLHRFDHGDRGATAPRQAARVAAHKAPLRETGEWRQLWASYAEAATASTYAELAAHLGLPIEAVHKVNVGITPRNEWAFMMTAANGDVTGIKLRPRTGAQKAVFGSRLGVVRSIGFSTVAPTLVVTEGESDLMIAAHWGLNAISRPGCMACSDTIRRLSSEKTVVLICDNDDPGKAGAKKLADHIGGAARAVLIVWPPQKDLREWWKHGGSLDALRWRISSKSGKAEVPF